MYSEAEYVAADMAMVLQSLDHSVTETWIVRDILHHSDHHQIYIELNSTTVSDRDTDQRHNEGVYTWRLSNDPTKWEQLSQTLATNWPSVEQLIESKLQTPAEGREEALRDISASIRHLFHSAAKQHLGVRKRDRQWKKWIGGKAQAASITFHKYWLWFCRQRRHTSAQWKRLETLHYNRNRLMGNHKTNWLTKNFQEKGIQGKGGWQIASECRDLNEHRNRRISSLKDPDRPGQLITDNQDIAERCCTFSQGHG